MRRAGSSSSSRWVINVDKCTTYSNQRKKAPSIYRIPEHIAGEHPKLYQPQLVSLGAYHYKPGSVTSSLLETMNFDAAVEHVALSAQQLELVEEAYKKRLLKQFDELAGDYDELDTSSYSEKEREDFVMKMFGDGAFILGTLLSGSTEDVERHRYYHVLNKNTYVVPIFKQDMLLLQNQVPFWFLEYIVFISMGTGPEELDNYQVGNQTPKREWLLDLIIKLYSLPESTKRIKPPYLHILDIYRRGLISQDIHRDETKNKHEDSVPDKRDEIAQYFPSASKIYEAGILFMKSRTTNLKDVSYHHGTLRLPPFVITKDTVQTLANLMAFEKLHLHAGNEITSYVFILNCLIHNARDVSLLESHEVIQHTLRDDEDVVKSLALIGKDVAYPPDNMLEEIQIVSQQLKARRFKKRLNIWRLDLLEKYFNSPWGALSVLAAILLFTLTIIQTIYSVLSYVHPKK